MRFAFIDAEKAEIPVAQLCRALRVSRAGFYAWKRRAPSIRARQDDRLRVLIRDAHVRSRRTYGSPRLVTELAEQGIAVGSRRVARLMRAEGLVARARRRYRSTTMSEHDQPIAANVLDREFRAVQPNERWVGDTTELVAGGSRLFLAVLVDLFSRIVVGWAVSTVNDRHLALKALEMALRRRRPPAGLLHHTDQGSPYVS